MSTQQHREPSDDEPYTDATAREQRKLICRRLGTNENHRTELSKRSLNSLIAYLTGEFAITPDKLFTEDAPTKPELMDTVSVHVGLTEWMDHYTGVLHGHRSTFRAFNKRERAHILVEMDERGDARDWAPGEFEALVS